MRVCAVLPSGFLAWFFIVAACAAIALYFLIIKMGGRARENPANKRVFGITEGVFNILYLFTMLYFGLGLMFSGGGNTARLAAGCAALVLAFGDAFHLAPRIAVIIKGNENNMRGYLGRGKQITSVTMTIFYVILWHIGLLIFSPSAVKHVSYIVYSLALLRIILCFVPQNKWNKQHPPVKWAIYRNIPFFIIGIITAGLFYIYKDAPGGTGCMWLAILLSFTFYLPVVLWSNKNPKIGMLMLPKTCIYVWIVAMFL